MGRPGCGRVCCTGFLEGETSNRSCAANVSVCGVGVVVGREAGVPLTHCRGSEGTHVVCCLGACWLVVVVMPSVVGGGAVVGWWVCVV